MIRFYNGLVLTMQGEIKPEEAEVWVDGDKIAFVGVPTAEQLENAVFERQTDLGGDLIMPSFKNAHTHSAMTFLRSFADGLPLHEWLTQQIFPMEAKLDDERIYWFTKLAILEYLSSGEKNDFVMFYDLIFNSQNNGLVLIDEPEISLHLEWLQAMINDLIRISEKNSVSLLIATHSPDLVGENYELVQHLS